MAAEGEPAGGDGGSPPANAESVQVAVRVRPLDTGPGEVSSLEVVPGPGIELEASGAGPGVNGNAAGAGAACKRVSCSYDRVFGPEASQEEVFGFVGGVVPALLEGINCTLFTYGQTGSGKTHTLLGDQFETRIVEEGCSEAMASDPGRGIAVRLLQELFTSLDAAGDDTESSVLCSYAQIYNDKVYDALQDREMVHPLAVREFRSRGGVEIFVQGLSEFRAESWEDVLALLRVGSRNRVARSTRLNVHSSRSHAVLQLAVETDRLDGQSTRAKLSLIDLAGSEKMDVLSELRAMREQDGAGEEGEAADGGGAERGRSGSRSRSPWDRSFAGRAAASRGRGSDVSDASSGSDRDSLGPPEEARAPRRGRSVTRRRPPTDWRDTARRMRPGSQRPPQVPLDGSGGVTRGVAAGVRGIRALSRRSSSSHAGPRRAGGVPDEQLPTYPGASGGSALDGEAAAAARAAREQREKELRAINSSLSALGNVIAALTDASRKHIPYRDSTLTRILQDSLGGKARMFLVATLAPERQFAEESLSTMQFADRARNVLTHVRANKRTVAPAEMLESLRAALKQARAEAQRERSRADALAVQVEELQAQLEVRAGASGDEGEKERESSPAATSPGKEGAKRAHGFPSSPARTRESAAGGSDEVEGPLSGSQSSTPEGRGHAQCALEEQTSPGVDGGASPQANEAPVSRQGDEEKGGDDSSLPPDEPAVTGPALSVCTALGIADSVHALAAARGGGSRSEGALSTVVEVVVSLYRAREREGAEVAREREAFRRERERMRERVREMMTRQRALSTRLQEYSGQMARGLRGKGSPGGEGGVSQGSPGSSRTARSPLKEGGSPPRRATAPAAGPSPPQRAAAERGSGTSPGGGAGGSGSPLASPPSGKVPAASARSVDTAPGSGEEAGRGGRGADPPPSPPVAEGRSRNGAAPGGDRTGSGGGAAASPLTHPSPAPHTPGPASDQGSASEWGRAVSGAVPLPASPLTGHAGQDSVRSGEATGGGSPTAPGSPHGEQVAAAATGSTGAGRRVARSVSWQSDAQPGDDYQYPTGHTQRRGSDAARPLPGPASTGDRGYGAGGRGGAMKGGLQVAAGGGGRGMRPPPSAFPACAPEQAFPVESEGGAPSADAIRVPAWMSAGRDHGLSLPEARAVPRRAEGGSTQHHASPPAPAPAQAPLPAPAAAPLTGPVASPWTGPAVGAAGDWGRAVPQAAPHTHLSASLPQPHSTRSPAPPAVSGAAHYSSAAPYTNPWGPSALSSPWAPGTAQPVASPLPAPAPAPRAPLPPLGATAPAVSPQYGSYAGPSSVTAAPSPSARDVQLLMSQTEATEGQAVDALRQAGGDIATAILHLLRSPGGGGVGGGAGGAAPRTNAGYYHAAPRRYGGPSPVPSVYHTTAGGFGATSGGAGARPYPQWHTGARDALAGGRYDGWRGGAAAQSSTDFAASGQGPVGAYSSVGADAGHTSLPATGDGAGSWPERADSRDGDSEYGDTGGAFDPGAGAKGGAAFDPGAEDEAAAARWRAHDAHQGPALGVRGWAAAQVAASPLHASATAQPTRARRQAAAAAAAQNGRRGRRRRR